LVFTDAIVHRQASDPSSLTPDTMNTESRQIEAEASDSHIRLAESSEVHEEVEEECGKADQLIERLIRDHAADLLVIGPGSPQNLRERIFGSTADRVVRVGLCPVLVVKRATDDPYRRVIAAVDFSPMSFAAAQTAAQIAPLAKLELIHAFEIPHTFEQAMLKVGTSQAELDRYREAKAQTAYAELRSVRADLAVAGKIRVVRGDPATALVRVARSGRADLIALGIQGKNAVSRLILGSVARRVLAASSCDVLLAGGAMSRD